MERSRILVELDARPAEDKKRIRAATENGRALEDAADRRAQMALLGQQRWARPGAVIMFGFVTTTRILGFIDGRQRGWFDVLATLGFMAMTAFCVRRWLLMRRLERTFGLTKESFR